MDITDPHGRLARWAIYLQIFNFTIEFSSGIQHIYADVMRRINQLQIANITFSNKNNDSYLKTLDVWED
jgi:hypothetical protein